MISNARVFEKKEFIGMPQADRFEACDYFYPFSRQGLYFLFQEEKYNSVLLPSYVAEGVIDPFKRLGYRIEFYDVDENGYLYPNTFDKKVDVFVYIHYFGLYNEQNIEFINQNRENISFFVEDFSHVVFHENLPWSGDICIFSFTKIFGVIEGSCIRFNHMKVKSARYVQNRRYTRKLRTSLYLEKVLTSYCKNIKLNGWLSKVLHVFGVRDYYALLMASYDLNYPRLDAASFKTLLCLDIDKIIQVRKKYVEMYLEFLHPELLLDIPKAYYEEQALFAFPVKVQSRDVFVRQLRKRGIGAYTLTNHWWFNDRGGDKTLYNTHVLLPVNHNLKKQEIERVIEQVNDVFCKME